MHQVYPIILTCFRKPNENRKANISHANILLMVVCHTPTVSDGPAAVTCIRCLLWLNSD